MDIGSPAETWTARPQLVLLPMRPGGRQGGSYPPAMCLRETSVIFVLQEDGHIDIALLPTTEDTLGDWWVAARKRIDKRYLRGFDTLCTSVCWNLWKPRNDKVFHNNNIVNEWGAADLTHQEIMLWASARGREEQYGIE